MHRRHSALLLVAFAAGGVLAPAVHRVHHTAQAVAARSTHAAAGHHHHGALDAHGLEWTATCDRRVALDELTCVLCKGLSAVDVPAVMALAAPPAALQTAAARVLPITLRRAGVSQVRGPPHGIA